MRIKAEDVQVNDPQKAMDRFRAALKKVVRAPKTETKAKHKHATARPRKTPKG